MISLLVIWLSYCRSHHPAEQVAISALPKAMFTMARYSRWPLERPPYPLHVWAAPLLPPTFRTSANRDRGPVIVHGLRFRTEL